MNRIETDLTSMCLYHVIVLQLYKLYDFNITNTTYITLSKNKCLSLEIIKTKVEPHKF